MKLKYFLNGQTHELPLSTDKPQGKAFAVHFDNQTYYAAVLPAQYSQANNFRLCLDGEIYTLSEYDRSKMLTYGGESNIAITLNGTEQVNADPTKLIFLGNLKADDYAGNVVSITAAEGANYGENFYIEGNDNDNVIISNGAGITLFGGEGNDTLIGKGNDFAGGGASDMFVVNLTGDNVITDFDSSVDQISLTGDNLRNIRDVVSLDSDVKLVFENGSLTIKDFAGKSFIANAGGTLKAGSEAATIGGRNVSLVGGSGSNYFFVGGGSITVTGYTYVSSSANNDRIVLGDCALYNPSLDSSTSVVTAPLADMYLNPKGTLYMTGITASKPTNFVCKNVSHIRYFRTDPSMGWFSNSDPTRATSVHICNQKGDYGVLGKTNPSLASYNVANETLQGAEYYAGVISITSCFADSFIYGNAQYNNITVAGGKYNFILGGLGNDSITFEQGGGMFLGYGIGATYDGKKISFAKSTTQAKTSYTYAYDRFNPAVIYNNEEYLCLKGTVTGVYCVKHDNATSKKEATCTYVITYIDKSGETQIIVLRDIIKKPTTTNATLSKQVFDTNKVAVAWNIYHGANGDIAVLATNLKNMLHEDTDLPGYLQERVAKLNAIYNHLADSNVYGRAFTNSLVSTTTKTCLFNTLGAGDPLPDDFAGFK